MAGARDDMIIRPLLRRGRRESVRDKTRERAREERKTQRAKNHKKSLVRRIRRATRARRIRTARAKAAKLRGGGLTRSATKLASKGAVRAAGVAAGAALGVLGAVVGVLVALSEAVIQGGRVARRLSGMSARLVDATDAQTLYGGMGVNLQADLATVGFVESNEDLLRIIGRQDAITPQIRELMNEKRRMFLMQAQGADMINRSAEFDSADTLIDLIIAAARRDDLKGLADKAGAAIKTKAVHIGGHVPAMGR